MPSVVADRWSGQVESGWPVGASSFQVAAGSCRIARASHRVASPSHLITIHIDDGAGDLDLVGRGGGRDWRVAAAAWRRVTAAAADSERNGTDTNTLATQKDTRLDAWNSSGPCVKCFLRVVSCWLHALCACAGCALCGVVHLRWTALTSAAWEVMRVWLRVTAAADRAAVMTAIRWPERTRKDMARGRCVQS